MRYCIVTVMLSVCLSIMAQTDKQTEKLKEKHKGWIACFVVKKSNDTIYGKVKYQDDYSSTSTDNFMFGKGWVIALKDESEMKLNPAEIKELNIYNHTPGFKKYIVLGKPGKEILYRVIIEGPCSLLYEQRTSGGYGVAQTAYVMETVQERYYLYYKEQLSMAVNETMLENIPIKYRKKCSELLSECPAIASRLDEEVKYGDDLTKVVKDFNKCVAAK